MKPIQRTLALSLIPFITAISTAADSAAEAITPVNTSTAADAQNVKIISNNSHVTLRGVVESEDEHQAVLKLAKAHADPAKITDDLKVNKK